METFLEDLVKKILKSQVIWNFPNFIELLNKECQKSLHSNSLLSLLHGKQNGFISCCREKFSTGKISNTVITGWIGVKQHKMKIACVTIIKNKLITYRTLLLKNRHTLKCVFIFQDIDWNVFNVNKYKQLKCLVDSEPVSQRQSSKLQLEVSSVFLVCSPLIKSKFWNLGTQPIILIFPSSDVVSSFYILLSPYINNKDNLSTIKILAITYITFITQYSERGNYILSYLN